MTVIKKKERLQRDLLWQGGMTNNIYHLVDWDLVCNSQEGGLGLWPMQQVHRALMGKVA